MFGRRKYFKPFIHLLAHSQLQLNPKHYADILSIISNMMSMQNILSFKDLYPFDLGVIHSSLVCSCMNSTDFVNLLFYILANYMKNYNPEIINHILNILFEIVYYTPIKFKILLKMPTVLRLLNKHLDPKQSV